MFVFPEKMLQVFRNEQIQERFEQNGFVVLPFYNDEEMEELRTLYRRLHPSNETGFFPSTFSNDKSYRQKADFEIRRLCERSMQGYLKDYKVVCGAFIAKSPGPESGMCVHQDMSLVDESRFSGINIWVPLVDLTITNGTLFVLPGSHRIFPTYRGSSIPEFFQEVSEELIDYLEPICIKAGEAVFFDQSIIHFSPPNYTDEVRVVTNTYFTHQKAEFRTFYFNKDIFSDKVEAFAQSDSFMTDFEQFGTNIHNRPTVGVSLGYMDYNFPSINKEYLAKHFKQTKAREMIYEAIPKMENFPTVNSKLKQGFWGKLLYSLSR
jgi:ectoine hydroxylase-related dioxygenase (phytanoyl-CoA dioxygenase family)